MEFAGEVEEVGSAVQEFEAGDRVFGVNSFGANAEYVCIRERRGLAHMPAGSPSRRRQRAWTEAASRSSAYVVPATRWEAVVSTSASGSSAASR